jgi:hypothetical protein
VAWRSSSLEAGLAFALVVAAGCANRTDAEVRSAWKQRGADAAGATDGGEDGRSEKPDDRRRRRRGPRSDAPEGWARLENLLQRASSVLARSPEPETLAHLAHRWCEVEPEPETTEDGWVRVCNPIPPLAVDGHAFALEVGAVGVIGLVASDLSGADSSALVQQALRATKSLCARPWQEVPSMEFHTCPIEGGPTLAVGRISNGKRAGWQVSISILGAS